MNPVLAHKAWRALLLVATLCVVALLVSFNADSGQGAVSAPSRVGVADPPRAHPAEGAPAPTERERQLAETGLYSPRTPFPPLAVSPEQFALSKDNAYACPSGGGERCLWVRDPAIARSASEARWMAQQGFPTTRQRMESAGRPPALLLEEAKRRNDIALQALALEQSGIASDEKQDINAAVSDLEELAERSGTLYGLTAAARLAVHGAQVERVREDRSTAPWAEREFEQRAVQLALKAAMLGDPLVLDEIRYGLGSGVSDPPVDLVGLVVASRDLWRRARDQQARVAGQPSWASVPPRPVPYREIAFRADGEEIESWYGEQ